MYCYPQCNQSMYHYNLNNINGETFDETHERDVPTALQMVTFTKVSKRKKKFKETKMG